MALTSDGMESETRHGGLADVHGQLMDFVHDEGTAQCQQSARDGRGACGSEPPITSAGLSK